jgi:hypothetical protein
METITFDAFKFFDELYDYCLGANCLSIPDIIHVARLHGFECVEWTGIYERFFMLPAPGIEFDQLHLVLFNSCPERSLNAMADFHQQVDRRRISLQDIRQDIKEIPHLEVSDDTDIKVMREFLVSYPDEMKAEYLNS